MNTQSFTLTRAFQRAKALWPLLTASQHREVLALMDRLFDDNQKTKPKLSTAQRSALIRTGGR